MLLELALNPLSSNGYFTFIQDENYVRYQRFSSKNLTLISSAFLVPFAILFVRFI